LNLHQPEKRSRLRRVRVSSKLKAQSSKEKQKRVIGSLEKLKAESSKVKVKKEKLKDRRSGAA